MITEKFNKKVRELTKRYGLKQVAMGMDEEAEHKDVTRGNETTTAKIVNAHLKEDPKYYTKLAKAMA